MGKNLETRVIPDHFSKRFRIIISIMKNTKTAKVLDFISTISSSKGKLKVFPMGPETFMKSAQFHKEPARTAKTKPHEIWNLI